MVYLKFLSMIVATVVSAMVVALSGDDVISVAEWINVLITFFGAIAVMGAGNLPEGVWRYTKGIVAFVSAGLVFLASIIGNGDLSAITVSEWLQVGLAAAGAVGVLALKGPFVQPTTARATA